MGNWSEKIIQLTDTKLKGVRDKEIRFFRIDEFKRNIKRVDEFSASCPECKKEMINISEVVATLEEAINGPGKKRREYDRLISRLSDHMRKGHGFFAPYYFSYLYAFYGIVAGFLLGFVLTKLIPANDWEMLLIGVAIGIIVSYIIGSVKDKKVRSQKKLM